MTRLAILMMLSSCTYRWDSEEIIDDLRVLTGMQATDPQGFATFRIDVDDDENAMLVSSSAAGELIYIARLDGPNGTVFEASALWESPYSVTNAGFASTVPTLNWPTDPNTSLTPGIWTVWVGANTGNVQIDTTVMLKRDVDISDGILDVTLTFAGETGLDAPLVAAVQDAMVLWQELYETIGIELLFDTQTTLTDTILSPPGLETSSVYFEISSASPLRTIDVIIVEDIDFEQPIFGYSGDIPGTLIASDRSAVVVSSLYASGPDLQFDEEEIRLLSETFAHETLHYLGLFHPVEATYDHWDNLQDTPECHSEIDCEAVMADYLMFPYPICGMVGGCEPQSVLTNEQGLTANSYTGIQ